MINPHIAFVVSNQNVASEPIGLGFTDFGYIGIDQLYHKHIVLFITSDCETQILAQRSTRILPVY